MKDISIQSERWGIQETERERETDRQTDEEHDKMKLKGKEDGEKVCENNGK